MTDRSMIPRARARTVARSLVAREPRSVARCRDAQVTTHVSETDEQAARASYAVGEPKAAAAGAGGWAGLATCCALSPLAGYIPLHHLGTRALLLVSLCRVSERGFDGELPGGGGGDGGDPAPGREGGAAVLVDERGGGDAGQPGPLRRARHAPPRRGAPGRRRAAHRAAHPRQAPQAQGDPPPRPRLPPHHHPRGDKGGAGEEEGEAEEGEAAAGGVEAEAAAEQGTLCGGDGGRGGGR